MEISGVVPAPTRHRSVRMCSAPASPKCRRARLPRALLSSLNLNHHNIVRSRKPKQLPNTKSSSSQRRDPSPDPRVFSLPLLPDTRFVAFCRPPPLPRVLTEFSATGNCFPILREKSDCAEVASAPSDPASEVTRLLTSFRLYSLRIQRT